MTKFWKNSASNDSRAVTFKVELSPAAKRHLRKINPVVRERILRRLICLETDPRPSGVVKLEGITGYYRLRVGDYRVIYRIEDERLIVVVMRIGHRREVYR